MAGGEGEAEGEAEEGKQWHFVWCQKFYEIWWVLKTQCQSNGNYTRLQENNMHNMFGGIQTHYCHNVGKCNDVECLQEHVNTCFKDKH